MTLKEQILELLADGKAYNYKDIAKRLKAASTSVNTILNTLVSEDKLAHEYVIIRKRKAGWYKLNKKESVTTNPKNRGAK